MWPQMLFTQSWKARESATRRPCPPRPLVRPRAPIDSCGDLLLTRAMDSLRELRDTMASTHQKPPALFVSLNGRLRGAVLGIALTAFLVPVTLATDSPGET